MKGITALFALIALALGYYVFNDQKSVTDLIQDEIQSGAAAPARSHVPL